MTHDHKRIVTIQEAGREVWAGPYREFQAAFIDVLNVAEFCVLFNYGYLQIGDREDQRAKRIELHEVQ